MQNLHRHTSYSNIFIADSAASNEDYAKRAVELGHKTLSSVEHGWQGNYFQVYELAKKYNLKPIIGAEAYWVKDRIAEYKNIDKKGNETLGKDRSNHHILLLAASNMGRESINDILSEANISGYYYRPRVDIPLLLSLPPKDVVVTTACIAFKGYEDIDNIILQFADHFGNNFKLELQYHDTDIQREWNKHLLELHNRHNIPIIVGLDSHYILPNDAILRDYILEAKKVHYEDEDGWYMDYPSDEEIINRFKKQGVLTDEQIQEAMKETDVALDFCDYDNVRIFTKDIKLPSLYQGESKEQKDKRYSKLISQKFKEYMKKIPPEEYDRYFQGIKGEVQTYKDTGMVDYPLLDYEIVKDAVAHGGLITDTGRGCFTKDALVHTKDDMKSIADVQVGDYVIDQNGHFQKVLDTMSYDIQEDMVQIQYLYGNCKKYPNICTCDHKILIHRDGCNQWIAAVDIIPTDYVCLPKLKLEDKSQEIIVDLNDYNSFGYAYDEHYIYEYSPFINNEYEYSPKALSQHFNVSKKLMQDYANGVKDDFPRKPGLLQQILDYIPFDSTEAYREYIQHKRTRKITRYITLDNLFGQFIGLMYGDGCNSLKKNAVSLAINSVNFKNSINRTIFEQIAHRLGVEVQEHISTSRNLIQLTFYSKLISTFISDYLFVSQLNQIKKFNSQLLDLPKQCRNGILQGFFLSDGSRCEEDGCIRLSFDNTSSSLVNTMKLLSLETNHGITSLGWRNNGSDQRGYQRKESFKLRYAQNPFGAKKVCERCLVDDNYWYLPIKKITLIPNMKTTVYDLTVENSHSYLINNMIVHNSAVGFFTNTLCGFSKVDRFTSAIKLYPERFISTTRILSTKSLPDIDLNVGTPEIFEESQIRILGENHVAPMIAFGTLKKKSAFKLYARAKNMDFNLANTISEQISKYDEAVKYADDDADEIDIFDFIDEQYREYIEQSENYWGVISDKKKAPSAYLLYDGDIRREIGLIKCKSDTTKKEYLTCCIDGAIAENYKFLKNDILKVDVVLLIDKVFKRIGIEHFDVNTLIQKVKNDDKVWNIYANGYTISINQVEKEGSRKKCMRYKPHNISELSAFVAAIRPGFKSMYSKFEKREDFSWGIPALDNLLRTDELPVSFLFFQEQVMSVLNYAGFPMDECYGIIKAIAKKHPEKVKPLKAQFIEGIKTKLIEKEHISENEAAKNADDMWEVINNNCNYSFNASHAYCMALDSLYQAWQKAYYPYEFYEVLLQHYADKGNKDKVSELKSEMKKAFNISEGSYRFREDNRKFTADPDNHRIIPSLASIKSISQTTADDLYALKDGIYNTFVDLLDKIAETSCNSRQLEILIKLDFFEEFGEINTLLETMRLYDILRNAKTLKFDKLKELNLKVADCEPFAVKITAKTIKLADAKGLLEYVISKSKVPEANVKERLKYQSEYLGYVSSVYPQADPDYYYVTKIKGDYSRIVSLYQLHSGDTWDIKIRKSKFEKFPIQEGDIIKVKDFGLEKKWRKDETKPENEQWYQIEELEEILQNYSVLT